MRQIWRCLTCAKKYGFDRIVGANYRACRYPDWGYLVLGQWSPFNWREGIISVSFEIYDYLLISPIERTKRRSLTVTLMEGVLKGVKNIYILERQQIQKWQIKNLIYQKRKIKMFMKLVNLRVVKCNFRKHKAKLLTIAEPKGANRYLRKSGNKICRLNQKVKMDSWTIYYFRCWLNRIPIMGICP